MKCVCGYEHLQEPNLEWRKEEDPNFVNGDEDFHLITTPLYIGYEDRRVYGYVCPKCGTVRIERW